MSMLDFRVARAGVGILLALALVSCDEDPVAPDEHADAEGFALELDGVEALRYRESVGGSPSLTLDAGTTYEARIVFLDEDGDPLPHEEHAAGEEEHGVRVDIVNGALLLWVGEEHDEGEEHDFLEFHGELTAVATGATTIRVCLLHEDHCDFESPFLGVAID